MDFLVVSLYQIVPILQPETVVASHKEFLHSRDMTGRIYISKNGINAQFSGQPQDVDDYLRWLRADDRFADTVAKMQPYHENAFPRMTVKVRQELVALGQEVDLTNRAEHVSPERWRSMLEDDQEYVCLDVRNDYEWDVGHFEGFDRPKCETFRDFIQQAEELATQNESKATKVMMCCTGGIRCEFYGSLLKAKGFDQVYQLEGGILQYAAEQEGKHWKGKLFVFDDRLVVDVKGDEVIGKCHRCGASIDTYYNCANMDCNALFISCEPCHAELKGCCQSDCLENGRVRPYRKLQGSKPFRRAHVCA